METKTNNDGHSKGDPLPIPMVVEVHESEDERDEVRQFRMAELYVEAARTTTRRCYWAYSALLLICITAGLTFYNEYCSYTEKVIKMSDIVLSEPLKSEYISILAQNQIYSPADTVFYNNNNVIFNTLWRRLVENWVDTQYMSIPLLGIKLSTSDVMAIMSFMFIIIMAWCYYCIRSENFAVGKVLRSTQSNKYLDVKKYVFYGICFNNIFFPTTSRDTPYGGLKEKKNVVTEISTHQGKLEHNDKFFVKLKRYIPKILFLLPILLLCVDIGMHISDLCTLDSTNYNCFKELIKNPNNPDAITMAKATVLQNKVIVNGNVVHLNDEKIFRLGFPHGITSVVDKGGTGMIWKSLIITSIILVIVILIMHRIFRYLNGTSKTLREYKWLIKNEEARHKLLKIFNGEGDPKGEKKTVNEIILVNSDTKDSRLFGSNVYFGLTGTTEKELIAHLQWAIDHLDGARKTVTESKIEEDIKQIEDNNLLEHYLIFRASNIVTEQ